MFANLFSITFKSVRHRPLRSWLTIVGIVIGTMLVVAIMSMSSGIRNVITQKLQMLGSQLIVIIPGDESNPFSSIVGGIKFREKDITDLQNIAGVQDAVPWDMGGLVVENNGQKKSISVLASYVRKMVEVFQVTQGFDLQSGRWPTDDNANEVVLGNTVAMKMFKHPIRVGDDLLIQSKRMKVVGIVKYLGASDDDQRIYMSWPIFHMLAGLKPAAMEGMVIVQRGADMNLVAAQIRYQLSQQDVVDKFAVYTPQKIQNLAGSIVSIVELALIMIALVSLIVGAVGIMNTMYTSVLERTKQIGIMKAIGASSESILTLFLIESGVIGIVGGMFGIIAGIGFAGIVGIAAGALAGISGLFSFASLDYLGFLVVLVVAFMTGVIAGILPARQAARLEPAEALRYE